MKGVPKGYASVFILPRRLHNQRFSRSVFTPAGKFEAFSNASLPDSFKVFEGLLLGYCRLCWSRYAHLSASVSVLETPKRRTSIGRTTRFSPLPPVINLQELKVNPPIETYLSHSACKGFVESISGTVVTTLAFLASDVGCDAMKLWCTSGEH